MNPLIKQIPVVSQAYGFTKDAMKVYNSTSPIEAVKVAAVSIIDDCAPPQIKYPVKCGILVAQVASIEQMTFYFSKKRGLLTCLGNGVIPYTRFDFPYLDLCPGFSNPGNVLTILNIESYCKSLLFVSVIVNAF